MMAVAKSKTMSYRSQTGLTLMELMVALALGGFLVLGVVNVFLTTRESSSLEAALSRVQDSGRFAMDVLADDLRRAHYTGCNSVNRGPDVMVKDFNYVGVRGYIREDGSWSDPLDANDPSLVTISTDDDIEGSIRAGTDVLNLHLSTHLGNDLLTSDIGPSDDNFTISSNPDCLLESGDVAIISNCLTAHVFWADVAPTCSDPDAAATVTVNEAKKIAGAQLDGGYVADSRTQLMKFETATWYVGDTGRERNDLNVYALYRQSINDAPQEMVEGVEFMQVLYGQRVDGGGEVATTRFLRADDPDLDFGEVVSVRLGLLIQNYDPVRDDNDARTYVLADPVSPITPAQHGGDLVLRQAFRVTIALRNTPYDQ